MMNTTVINGSDALINYSDAEIFDAAGNNDVDRMRELLDSGFDINMTDFDKGMILIHFARIHLLAARIAVWDVANVFAPTFARIVDRVVGRRGLPDAFLTGWTPLHVAAARGRTAHTA